MAEQDSGFSASPRCDLYTAKGRSNGRQQCTRGGRASGTRRYQNPHRLEGARGLIPTGVRKGERVGCCVKYCFRPCCQTRSAVTKLSRCPVWSQSRRVRPLLSVSQLDCAKATKDGFTLLRQTDPCQCRSETSIPIPSPALPSAR
jgi:hypothetical protein